MAQKRCFAKSVFLCFKSILSSFKYGTEISFYATIMNSPTQFVHVKSSHVLPLKIITVLKKIKILTRTLSKNAKRLEIKQKLKTNM